MSKNPDNLFDPVFAEEIDQEISRISPEKEEESDASNSGNENKVAAADRDLLRQYVREINRFELLTPEEEKELTLRYYETRAREVYDRLINSNLRLVLKMALEFQKFWMKNLLDLIQEGNIGLMHGIRKFDPHRGIKLSYYVSFWIKAYILRFVMDNWRLVKIGTTQAQRKLFYNLRKEKERLRALGFDTDTELLAKNLNVPEEDVIEVDSRLGRWELSLDAPLKEGSDEYHKNFLPATEPSVEEEIDRDKIISDFNKFLEEFREKLNSKELSVLDLRLLAENPSTLDQIGKIYGLSRERIRQIEKKLKKNLRSFLKKKGFECESEKNYVFEASDFKGLLKNFPEPEQWALELAQRIWGKKLLRELKGSARFFNSPRYLAYALEKFEHPTKTLTLLELIFGEENIKMRQAGEQTGSSERTARHLKDKALQKIANFPISLLMEIGRPLTRPVRAGT